MTSELNGAAIPESSAVRLALLESEEAKLQQAIAEREAQIEPLRRDLVNIVRCRREIEANNAAWQEMRRQQTALQRKRTTFREIVKNVALQGPHTAAAITAELRANLSRVSAELSVLARAGEIAHRSIYWGPPTEWKPPAHDVEQPPYKAVRLAEKDEATP